MALAKGSKGLEVSKVQDWLTKCKVYTGPIDGVFGTLMWESVMKFQQIHGLKVDGIVGPQTMAKLIDVLKPKSTSLPLAGKQFIVTGGHGGKDPGAVDPINKAENDTLNTRESNLVLIYAREFAQILRTNGADVIELRTTDRYISPEDKVKESKKYPDADAYFEFHANAAGANAAGFEALTYTNTGTGYRVAQNIVTEVKKSGLRIHGAGVFIRPDLIVLHHTPMPANIFEIGFITNVVEEGELNTRLYQIDALQAIYRGVLAEFGKAKALGYKYEHIHRGANEIHLVTVKNPNLSVTAAPFGTRMTVDKLVDGIGAKLALNGGYFYINPKTGAVAPVTPVIAYGQQVGSKAKRQIAKRAAFCVLKDGSMQIRQVWGYNELADCKHAIGAGPVIVFNGKVKIDLTEKWETAIVNSKTSRSFVGLADAHTLLFGVATKAGGGITLKDLGVFLVERGCKQAMDLDGGGSSALWPKVDIEHRPVTNALLLM